MNKSIFIQYLYSKIFIKVENKCIENYLYILYFQQKKKLKFFDILSVCH